MSDPSEEVPTPQELVEVEPFTLRSDDIAALAGHLGEVVARVDETDTCKQLHAMSLEGAAAVAAVVGDGPITPDLTDVPDEDLMHAGGLMLWIYAPNPGMPYGRWGDAVLATLSAIEMQVEGMATEQEGVLAEELDEDVVAALDAQDPAVLQERYEDLGCSPPEEADAIAGHLGLPASGVDRDRAALVSLSSLVDEVATDSIDELALLPLSADERHRASLLLRLLHGPAQPDDVYVVTALLDDLRTAVEGSTTQADVDEAMTTLPLALAETSSALVGDDGTCISLELRRTLVVSSTEANAPVVVAERPDEFGVPDDELFAGVALPACEG